MKCLGKVSIVTGGGKGIGAAIALALAREGSDVAIFDLDGDRAAEVARKIQGIGRKSLSVRTDVSKSQEVRAAVDEVSKEFSKVDILINNAGICQTSTIADLQEEDWDRMFAVNMKGVFLCSRAVMDSMKRQKWGKIVNLGSIAGKVGGIIAGPHYSASKAAVMCFTKSLARELAPYGINVNAIAPGVIQTDMTLMLTKGDWDPYAKSIPLGRIGTVEEAARVVVFLVSDDASYLTGEIIDINGGQLMD
jgi:3-oxoacyl-[acyl-carrier protein] reductase